MFYSEYVTTVTPQITNHSITLPKLNEDFQITTEHNFNTNNLIFFYNNTIYNLALPFNTENGRVTTIKYEENGQVILQIGNSSSKYYNVGFKLNGLWNETQKQDLVDGYKYLKPDVKINSLEVNNLILNGAINNWSLINLRIGILQDAGGGKRRNVIENWGTFICNNELVPSTNLTSN